MNLQRVTDTALQSQESNRVLAEALRQNPDLEDAASRVEDSGMKIDAAVASLHMMAADVESRIYQQTKGLDPAIVINDAFTAMATEIQPPNEMGWGAWIDQNPYSPESQEFLAQTLQRVFLQARVAGNPEGERLYLETIERMAFEGELKGMPMWKGMDILPTQGKTLQQLQEQTGAPAQPGSSGTKPGQQ